MFSMFNLPWDVCVIAPGIKKTEEEMSREHFWEFLREDDGMGVVEVILIIVVLIGLVIMFQSSIKGVVTSILSTIQKNAATVK